MEVYQESLELFPDKAKELEFEFKYDVASFLQSIASRISLAGLQKITGVNQKQLGHYLNGHRKPSHTTVVKIEKGIKEFQEELSRISLV